MQYMNIVFTVKDIYLKYFLYFCIVRTFWVKYYFIKYTKLYRRICAEFIEFKQLMFFNNVGIFLSVGIHYV